MEKVQASDINHIMVRVATTKTAIVVVWASESCTNHDALNALDKVLSGESREAAREAALTYAWQLAAKYNCPVFERTR